MPLPEPRPLKMPREIRYPAGGWIIKSWLPNAELAALHGPSGIGKSTLALRLAAAVATGRTGWLPGALELDSDLPAPAPPAPAPAVFMSMHDPAGIQADRLRRAGCAFALAMASVRSPAFPSGFHCVDEPRLHFVDAARGGCLWLFDPEGGGMTPEARQLLDDCERLSARLLVIDPKQLAFRGSRYHAFSELRAWAQRAGCAVLVVGVDEEDWPAPPAKAVWQLKRTDGGARLECDWSTHAALPAPVQLAGSDPARWRPA